MRFPTALPSAVLRSPGSSTSVSRFPGPCGNFIAFGSTDDEMPAKAQRPYSAWSCSGDYRLPAALIQRWWYEVLASWAYGTLHMQARLVCHHDGIRLPAILIVLYCRYAFWVLVFWFECVWSRLR